MLGISTDADDFTDFAGHSYLLFTRGRFRPTRFSPATGEEVFPERPRGVADLFVPRGFAAGGGDRESVLECTGIRGGMNTVIRVTSMPARSARENPFSFDIDSGDQFHRYNWYGRDTLRLDRRLGHMKSEDRLLMRIRSGP